MDKPDPKIRFVRFELSQKRLHKGGMIDAAGYFSTLEEASSRIPDDTDVEIYDAWTGEVHQLGYDGRIT